MDQKLIEIKDTLLAGRSAEMDEEMFKHTTKLKFAISVLLDYAHKHRHEQVKLIQEEFVQEALSNSFCYKLLSDAQELYPAIETVNKAFELNRLKAIGYKLLQMAIDKRNVRDGASLMKVLTNIVDLAAADESTGTKVNIINILRCSPESLGIKIPEGFDDVDFINKLEKDYARTIDIGHTEE